MFLLSFGKKIKRVFFAVFCVLLMTAVAVVIMWLCDVQKAGGESGFPYVLESSEGIAGFLGKYSLEYAGTENVREITLPLKDDATFSAYDEFLSGIGMNILEFSGKKVEERYLKLKNKTPKGQPLYAVLYIYGEKVVGGHLTTFEQGEDYLLLDAFT